MNPKISRRTLLGAGGIAITLPWMESLTPNLARAQANMPKRYLPIYFANGRAGYWTPAQAGEGANWQLSPILEPLQPLKEKMIVISNLESYTCHGNSPEVEPSHGRAPGAWLTSANGDEARQRLGQEDANGISVDQLIAQNAMYSGLTPLASLQVGLSTTESFCDGRPCSYSRSISWKSETEPLYKDVSPVSVYDRLVALGPIAGGGEGGGAAPNPEAERIRAMNESVLDAVLENAERTKLRMGACDIAKMDAFLTSVREVEMQVVSVGQTMAGGMVTNVPRPTITAQYNLANGQDGYSKEDHSNVMKDLIVMAFQSDATRIISYMLDDERSEFVYDHLTERSFTTTGSTAGGGGSVGNYHGLQHAGDLNNGFATINWWNSTKVFDICSALDAIEDAPGVSMLDNTIVMYASCMNGGSHDSNDLPVALLGGGGGLLKTNQHVIYTPDRPLRDLHLTVLNSFYGLNVASFGQHMQGAPNTILAEILA